jgi:hypothetical protein
VFELEETKEIQNDEATNLIPNETQNPVATDKTEGFFF